MDGNILKPVDPNAETDPFSSKLVDAINSPKSITFANTPQDSNDFIDSFNNGTVDVGDLQSLSGDIYKSSVLQFTAERLSVDDYSSYLQDYSKEIAGKKWSDELNTLYGNKFAPTVSKANDAGHKAVEDYLKSKNPDKKNIK